MLGYYGRESHFLSHGAGPGEWHTPSPLCLSFSLPLDPCSSHRSDHLETALLEELTDSLFTMQFLEHWR